jgi:4-amino-4-deoxy-L-arabinose transferase-like glycosyltransferase
MICLAAGLLCAWKIGDGQMGNTYYSAAVKSMTDNFSNFLFGSFDPYGVFTVDKPPMSLWPQVISVLIFGYHGWSLLLPETIAGVAAVFLLHRTVRLWAGENVALLAALILAVTPITVVMNRDNNPDTLLNLLLIAAAYAVTRSVQAPSSRGRTKWLLWCAFFVGCGFLTKMLQAWIIVPALALAFLIGVTGPVKRRILDLLGAAVVFVSSFWWVALHDWWPGNKPYIGGSTDGTAWNLIFGYNGFGRTFGQGDGSGGGMVIAQGGTVTTSSFGGDIGIGRMFNDLVGGQISWLLPLSLLVLAVVSVMGVQAIVTKAPGVPARRAGWFLWGGWLLVTAIVFSYAQGIWHPYYTTAMAPAIAALSAAGLAVLWRSYRESDSVAWVLLPLAIAMSVAWAFVLVSRDTSWHGWIRWVVLVAAAVAIFALVFGRLSQAHRRTVGRPALVAGVVSLLLTPGVWSVAAAAQGNSDGNTPAAGPAAPGGMPPAGPLPAVAGMAPPPKAGGRNPGQGQEQPVIITGGGGGETKLTDEQRRILDYAEKHGDGAKIALGVNSAAGSVAPYIMGSDAMVIGMGGFGGRDNTPSVDQLRQWVDDGTLRFILSSPSGGQNAPAVREGPSGMSSAAEQERQHWIEQHCRVVEPNAYGGKSSANTGSRGGPDTGALYRCGGG